MAEVKLFIVCVWYAPSAGCSWSTAALQRCAHPQNGLADQLCTCNGVPLNTLLPPGPGHLTANLKKKNLTQDSSLPLTPFFFFRGLPPGKRVFQKGYHLPEPSLPPS